MKKIFITIGILICSILIFVVGYCGYVVLSYDRIGNVELEIDSKSSMAELKLNETYNVSTYNIGFGAYSQDFTFFLDTGYDIDGNETCGHDSKAKSKEEVIFNINGSIETIRSLDLDFVLLQEVDVKATRSHKVNQNQMFKDELVNYDNVLCINFNSTFLPYPLYDMHGKSLAGLSTFSKYKISKSDRVEYTISDSLSKLFDLDRCFNVNIIEVENGKKLYLINSHMSAYDKGGVIREKQIKELNDFINSCYDNGDYVLVGGDFNHDLLTYNPDFNYNKTLRVFNNVLKDPDWVASYFDESGNSPLNDNFKVVASDNVPTCRNNDIQWNPNETYVCVVDGFIVSKNIEVVKHFNVETENGNLGFDGFAYSDHQPAYLKFKLK